MDAENINKILIRKYLNQQCTQQEIEELKKLMDQPYIHQLFDEVLEESWTGLVAEENTDQPHLNLQLDLFYKKAGISVIDHQEDTKGGIIVWFNKNRRVLSRAAVWAVFVLGIMGYGIARFKKSRSDIKVAMHEMANPYGQRSEIILPDSSEVFLGAGSKLTVPEKFTGNLREIKLEGEAFFQVTKNPLKPFIIHTGTVQTKVLGTSFKIEAFKNQPLTVAVVTGKVRVDNYVGSNHISLAVLTPGQQVTYNQGRAILGSVVINDIRSWKEGRQVFKDRPLKEITNVLERWYNVKFQYQNIEKSAGRISVTLFSKMPLNDVLTILGTTGHFKYVIRGKKVIIS